MVSLNFQELQQVLELLLGLWKVLVLQYQQGPVAKPQGLAWKMHFLLDRPREDFSSVSCESSCPGGGVTDFLSLGFRNVKPGILFSLACGC